MVPMAAAAERTAHFEFCFSFLRGIQANELKGRAPPRHLELVFIALKRLEP